MLISHAHKAAAYTVVDGDNFKRQASSATSLDCV